MNIVIPPGGFRNLAEIEAAFAQHVTVAERVNKENPNFRFLLVGSDADGKYHGFSFSQSGSRVIVELKGHDEAIRDAEPTHSQDPAVYEFGQIIAQSSQTDLIYSTHAKEIMGAMNKFTPAYSALMNQITFKADKSISTAQAGFDKQLRKFRILYNPSFILQAALDEWAYNRSSYQSLRDAYCYFACFIFAHEVCHIIKSHLTSVDAALSFDQFKSNQAKMEFGDFMNRVKDIYINLELGRTLSSFPFVKKITYPASGMTCEDKWVGTLDPKYKAEPLEVGFLITKSFKLHTTHNSCYYDQNGDYQNIVRNPPVLDSDSGVFWVRYPESNIGKICEGRSISLVKLIQDIKYNLFTNAKEIRAKSRKPSLNPAMKEISGIYRRIAKGHRLGLVSDDVMETVEASVKNCVDGINAVNANSQSDDLIIRVADIIRRESETLKSIMVSLSGDTQLEESYDLYRTALAFSLFEEEIAQPKIETAVSGALIAALAAAAVPLSFDAIPDPRERVVQDMGGAEIDASGGQQEPKELSMDDLDSAPMTVKNANVTTGDQDEDESPIDSDVEMDNVKVNNQPSQPSDNSQTSSEQSGEEQNLDQPDTGENSPSDSQPQDSSEPSDDSGEQSLNSPDSGEPGENGQEGEPGEGTPSNDGSSQSPGSGEQSFPDDAKANNAVEKTATEKALDELEDQLDKTETTESLGDKDSDKAIEDLVGDIADKSLASDEQMRQSDEKPDDTVQSDPAAPPTQLSREVQKAIDDMAREATKVVAEQGGDATELLQALGMKTKDNTNTAGRWKLGLKKALKKALSITDTWDQDAPSRRIQKQFGEEVEVNQVRKIVFSIDFSSSMGDDKFRAVLREIQTFLKESKLRDVEILVVFWAYDVKMSQYFTLRNTSTLVADIAKRGTAYKKGSNTILDAGILGIPIKMSRPDLVIIFTDGLFPATTPNPKVLQILHRYAAKGQLLWVLTPDGTLDRITGASNRLTFAQAFDAGAKQRAVKPTTNDKSLS